MPIIARCATFLFLFSAALQAAEIKGKVSNVAGGEPLGRVQVSILEAQRNTTTAIDGTFAMQDLPPGNYTLRLNAVGYRLLKIPFVVSSPGEIKEFSITMAPDNFRRTDKVEVRGDVFQGPDSASITETNLTSSEVKEASSVLADDPFRAVQALPGVSASNNNELLAEFSVMGAPFENVGIYIDDVLVPSPFHTAQNIYNGASLSLLTSETVEEIRLLPVAYPQKYGDDVGAALDIHTREGSRTAPLFRASIGMADSEFLGEGQLGHSKKGSWLASVRKSYLGQFVRSWAGYDYSDISFYDGAVKLTYDITQGQNLNFYMLSGHTNVDVSSAASSSEPNAIKNTAGDFIFSRLGWRWSITPHLLLDSRSAYIREPFTERNSSGQPLLHDSSGEWVGGSNLSWAPNKDHILGGGWTLRRLQDYSAYYGPDQTPIVTYSANRKALRGNGYIQQTSSFLGNRIHLSAGLRWDGQERQATHPFSPQVSVALQARSTTQLQFGFGRFNQFQFPDSQYAAAPDFCFQTAETYQRANHYTAAIEQRFGENTRIRLQAFDRENDVFLTTKPISPCSMPGPPSGTYKNSRGYSRGAQVLLQRRSANRLSGWIGYTLTYARQSYLTYPLQNQTYSPYFDAIADQRHSVNAFAMYRLTPSVNLSGKILYGSGFPAEATLENLPHLGTYVRLDVRTDKSWAFSRWKFTLYGEVLNLTNHYNPIFYYFTTVNGQTALVTHRSLPITPTAGLVFEF